MSGLHAAGWMAKRSKKSSSAKVPSRRTLKLIASLVILALAALLVWVADGALGFQYRLLEGCWPQSVDVDGQPVLTEAFWNDQVRDLDLNPLEGFFYSRARHRLLFYLNVLSSIIGWSGSIFLRLVTAEEGTPDGSPSMPTWQAMVASFVLAAIAGAILFLLLVSTRLIVDPNKTACIPEGYAYLSMVAGLGAGLFVVVFFGWFRSTVESLWSKVVGR